MAWVLCWQVCIGGVRSDKGCLRSWIGLWGSECAHGHGLVSGSCMQWFAGDDDEDRPGYTQPVGATTTQPGGAGLAVRAYCAHNDISAADRERQMLWKTRWHGTHRQAFWRQLSGQSGSITSHDALAHLPELRLAPSMPGDAPGGSDGRDGRDVAPAARDSVALDVASGTIDSGVEQVCLRAAHIAAPELCMHVTEWRGAAACRVSADCTCMW